MSLGERIRQARLALNMTQEELAIKSGISIRTVFAVEMSGMMPRVSTVQKISKALGVSTGYLLDEEDSGGDFNISGENQFLADVKEMYGSRGKREAEEVLSRASALFAGGGLDEEEKDVFFRSIMEVYLESKDEARSKFTPRKRASKKK